MTLRRIALPIFLVLTLAVAAPVCLGGRVGAEEARAEEAEAVGIDEKLGATLPQGLMFNDEAGKPVELRSLIQRPTILTLVYFRCPSICGPLLNELANTVDEVDDLAPGNDFDLITVSFDPAENPEMARNGKTNLLKRIKRDVPEDAWRFLTGEAESIKRLADAVGFRYKRTKDGQDYDHAGTVIFVSKEGKIVRYLGGLAMLPFDMKMAVNDARIGKERTIFQKIQSLCFGYDPDGKRYTLLVNRIVLFVTLLGIGIFALVLFLKRRRGPARPSPNNPSAAATEVVEGGTV